jgi:(R,R)-butanediol dehydrogenase/meso-butanediol dehydrogenase/diacetyl reductase
MMKAAFYEGHETIGIGECIPVPPGPGEVQIQVSHCGICGTDLHLFHGKMDHRVRTPQVIGHESSGTIAALGGGVDGWKLGDRVVVRPLHPCGKCPACKAGNRHICMQLKFIGIDVPGALQALWTVPAHTLHRLPQSVSLEHGSLIEPLSVACHDVRMGKVKGEDFVVILGGGPIGLLIALVAKHLGATVLISEVNPFRLKLASQLGLETIDPKNNDLVDHVNTVTHGSGADVVFEVTGAAVAVATMTKIARVRGRVVVVAIHSQPIPVDLFQFFWRELELTGARVYEPEDFEKAISLAAAGTLPLERIITRIIPLEKLEAGLKELEAGGEAMKILVRCS